MAQALKHDAQGFLVGDPVDLDKLLAVWQEIRNDVRAIRMAIAGLDAATLHALPETHASAVVPAGRGERLDKTDHTDHTLAEAAQPFIAPDDDAAQNPPPTADRPVLSALPAAALPTVASSIALPVAQSDNAVTIARAVDRLRADLPAIAHVPVEPERRDARGHSEPLTRVANAGQALKAVEKQSKSLSQHAQPQPVSLGHQQKAQQSSAASYLKSDAKAATVQKDVTRIISPQGRGLRDEKGRFTAGTKSRQADPGKNRGEGDQDYGNGVLHSVGERVASAVKEVGTGLEEADPAVKAMQEVAQPLMRSYEFLTGGDGQKKQARWLRRIWQTLTGSRKEQGIFNKIAAKRLKAIEEKPVSEASGGGFLSGMLGMLGGLFAKIPGLKTLLSLTSGAAGVKAAAGAAAGAGAGVNRDTKAGSPKAGRFGGRMGKFLRRVPLLGALIGGASMAAEVYGSETDNSLNREQKDRRAGKSVGGFAGSVGGMVAGAKLGAIAGSLGGPIGTAIGGFVGGALGMFLGDQAGQIIGDKMGGWMTALRQADIPGMISTAWDSAVNFVKSGWEEIKGVALGAWDWVKSGWDAIKEAGLGAWDWMKSGWGEVTNAIGTGWESLKGTMKSAFEKTLGLLNSAWESTKKTAGDAKDLVVEKAGAASDWVVEKVGAVSDFVKDKVGIDVKEGATQAWETASAAASTAGDAVVRAGRSVLDKAIELKDKAVSLGAQTAEAVTDVGRSVIDKAVEIKDRAVALGGQATEAVGRGVDWVAENTTAGRGVGAAWRGAKLLGNWVLGQTSKIFESGKGGAGTVSSGKGDHGGVSYGTYQLSSTQGTLQKFLAQSKYGEQFAGLRPGTPEFNAKWKEVAKNDPEFGDAQHGFIKETHYDPAMAGLKRFGIDLSERGAAVQDALWSSSVQFGAGSGKRGAIGMFRKALAGRDIAAMSDKEIVTAIQDYKIANNERLFASSSADVRAGTARRAVDEKSRLIALAEQSEREEVASQAATAASPATAATAPTAMTVGATAPELSPVTAVVTATEIPDISAAARSSSSLHTPSGTYAPYTPAAALAPVSVSIPAPKAPSIPSVSSAPNAPSVTVPLSSNSADRSVSVVTPLADISQDLRERGIAHIVTGGLSSSA